MLDTTSVDFSIMNNGIEIALAVQKKFTEAFIFNDGVILDDNGEFFKINTGKSLIGSLINQGKVLIVTFGVSGPISEYELSLR